MNQLPTQEVNEDDNQAFRVRVSSTSHNRDIRAGTHMYICAIYIFCRPPPSPPQRRRDPACCAWLARFFASFHTLVLASFYPKVRSRHCLAPFSRGRHAQRDRCPLSHCVTAGYTAFESFHLCTTFHNFGLRAIHVRRHCARNSARNALCVSENL